MRTADIDVDTNELHYQCQAWRFIETEVLGTVPSRSWRQPLSIFRVNSVWHTYNAMATTQFVKSNTMLSVRPTLARPPPPQVQQGLHGGSPASWSRHQFCKDAYPRNSHAH